MFLPHYEIDYRLCGIISYVYQSVVSTFYVQDPIITIANPNALKDCRSFWIFDRFFANCEIECCLELHYKIIELQKESDKSFTKLDIKNEIQ